MKLFIDPRETIPLQVYFDTGSGRVTGTVELLARMSAGILASVEAQTSRFEMNIEKGEDAADKAQRIGAEYSQTHAENVLLLANIKGWSGDLFGGRKPNRETILSLNPDHPVRLQMLEEIDRRNRPYQSEQADDNGNFLPESVT